MLILTLRTHDIMIFGGMNGKLVSEKFFWKWISLAGGENDEISVPNSCDKIAIELVRAEVCQSGQKTSLEF